MSDEPKITITCAVTGKTAETSVNADGTPKLPRGWKRHEGQCYHPSGWAQRYVARAIRLPVASVTVEGSDDREAGWKSFWASLRAAWGDATRYANLCLARYAAFDFGLPLEKTDDGKWKLPPVPQEIQNAWRREVYGLHHDFPAIDATSAAAISMECWGTWKKNRWQVRVAGDKSLPTFRYPFPLPIPAQAVKWSADTERMHADGRQKGNGWVTCRVRINGTAYLVRLSAGVRRKGGVRDYHRALDTIRTALKTEMKTGEVSLLLRDNAPWLSVTVNLPKRVRGTLDPDRTLSVKLGGGDLFRAVVADQERVWTLHADDFLPRVQRWDERRQRLADDRKFERRRGKNRKRYNRMTEGKTERHHDWLSTQIHRRTRELVEFARRNGCGRIEIDATTPIPGLPNHRLLEQVKQKADAYGMIVRVVGEAEPPADGNASAPVV